ncbi:MAG: dockerin type I repeat-containing protein, partial [Agathobacter sp.]|nr:dockerin type I repeat-containing protein [Agathobacter sp.]
SNNIELGTATVTLKFDGDFKGTRTETFEIVPKNAENLTYFDFKAYIYDGTEHKPPVVVMNGELTLVEGVDYIVEYVDNINAGTGKAIVKFEGFEGCSGNYAGTKELTFQIAPKFATDCIVTLETLENYTFTGTEYKPGVTVMDGEIQLVEQTEEMEETEGDYTVTYSNNINAGEATVTITFINNYTGESSQTFVIERKPITEADIEIEAIADQTYIGKTIIPENIVVKDKVSGVTLRPDEDYTVAADAENTYVGTGTVIISLDLEGNYIYTGEPIEANFNIVPRDASNVTISPIPEQKYTGQEITPELEVKDGDIVLIAGVDYTVVRYENNIEVGTEATVTISFKGNFKGEDKTATFTIIDPVPTSITSSVFTVSQSNGYISKITVGTTKYTLWSAFNEKDYVEIYDKSGAIVSNDKVLVTGMTAGITDEGTVTKRYTIVVTGDTNGDGKINITDMIAVKACTLKKSGLSGAYEKAGDVNGDGKINITDFIKVKATTLKKDTIVGVSVN